MGLFFWCAPERKTSKWILTSAQVKEHLQLLKDSCENDFAEESIATQEYYKENLVWLLTVSMYIH